MKKSAILYIQIGLYKFIIIRLLCRHATHFMIVTAAMPLNWGDTVRVAICFTRAVDFAR